MMEYSVVRRLGLALTVLALAGVYGGCSTPKKTDSGVPSAVDADQAQGGDSDSGAADGLETVNFEYDKYALTSGTKRTLKSNASILKDKPTLSVQVEGHCDERGGIQYNIALGEKRANSVRRYLMDLGVSGERISVISFGKERPLDSGSSEDAFARNRRANFVVTSR